MEPVRRPRAQAPSFHLSGARLGEPSADAPHLGRSRRLQRGLFRVVGGPSAFSRSFTLTASCSLKCCLTFSNKENLFYRPTWWHVRSSLSVLLLPGKCILAVPNGQSRENNFLRHEGRWAAWCRKMHSCQRAPHSDRAGGTPAGAGCWAMDEFQRRRGDGQFQHRPKGQRLPQLTAAGIDQVG